MSRPCRSPGAIYDDVTPKAKTPPLHGPCRRRCSRTLPHATTSRPSFAHPQNS
ncbi:hypothetical protein COLSTE_01389 [Collinsella stercoris DSM 13279]|uniref:Uncharacterized protein n=1 Tax=Collinsella stercoris DSM 13279 TaxID=445975 RepID=B6GBD0_9ACTN|nr:hypothetical protein COLSTE_01389 [Collinsella stercoris DSM 13279]